MVLSVSSVQQSDLVIYIFNFTHTHTHISLFRFFSTIDYYRILSIVPYAIQ